MAAHLARRDELTVWNRTSSRASAFCARYGCRVAATPRELASEAQVVITCLPTSREVEALLQGPDGLEAGLRSVGTLAAEICGECVPRQYAQALKNSMDQIRELARRIV